MSDILRIFVEAIIIGIPVGLIVALLHISIWLR